MINISLELDTRAKHLATRFLQTEGELLSVLMEMRRKKIFAILNYSGIFDYCERALRFSRAQSYYFKTVAEKAEEVPEIKTAIDQGELTLSEARRIVPVVTRGNFKEWILKAQSLPQPELERAVTEANPKAYKKDNIVPISLEFSELRASIDRETEENIKALQDLLSQKTHKAATMGEVLKWAAKVCREKHDPLLKTCRENPEKVHEGRWSLVSLGNAVRNPNRRPIPVSVKIAIYKRDQRRCSYQDKTGGRCKEKRWLHLHHIKEVVHGGENAIENLRTLCHAHHQLAHRHITYAI